MCDGDVAASVSQRLRAIPGGRRRPSTLGAPISGRSGKLAPISGRPGGPLRLRPAGPALALGDFPARLKDKLAPNVSLASRTTYRLGGAAEWLLEATEMADVIEAQRFALACGLPFSVLGFGSNLLVAQAGVPGLVVSLRGMNRLTRDGDRFVALGGASLVTLTKRAARAGLAGPEGLCGIPGSVGGAVVMNAGTRHTELAQHLERVRYLSADGELTTLTPRDIPFGYRSSGLSGGVVLEAVIRGTPAHPARVWARYERLLAEKTKSQPWAYGSCGCLFRNPPGDSAGRLIDAAGCKGWREGGVLVSRQHANFFVNQGGGTADEVERLIARVRARVYASFGVVLALEVTRLGPPLDVSASGRHRRAA